MEMLKKDKDCIKELMEKMMLEAKQDNPKAAFPYATILYSRFLTLLFTQIQYKNVSYNLDSRFRSLLVLAVLLNQYKSILSLPIGCNLLLEELLNRSYDDMFFKGPEIGAVRNFMCNKTPVTNLVLNMYSPEDTKDVKVTIDKFKLKKHIDTGISTLSLAMKSGKVLNKGLEVPNVTYNEINELIRIYKSTDDKSFFNIIYSLGLFLL